MEHKVYYDEKHWIGHVDIIRELTRYGEEAEILREEIIGCFEKVALVVKDPTVKMALAMAAGSLRLGKPVQVACFEN